ncbi:MAG: MBL fold metallo-hydrolase [Proteobacteria bacterium]|nr:MBL fold metallo-hydrolase [Pseudomonadota bacterium]MDA0992613.1 MBL fold metallo-hydrolase [Pseudomonadota bacterium]
MSRPVLSTPPTPGKAVEIGHGVRRLLAPNAGLMTGPGTNTYLIGEAEVAILDPGPAIDAHIEAILRDAPGPIKWILVTHTHPDHSPAACRLAQATGAQLLGQSPPDGQVQDRSFVPDRNLGNGDVLKTGEFALRAVHTPGHASNHICYRHEALRWLFTGDHIMSGSTVVIDPPDGNMKHYLESLELLKELDLAALAPGHGPVIDNPDETVDGLIRHRLSREAKVIASLIDHPLLSLHELTKIVYDEVDKNLHRLASRSLLAHLLKLETEGRASQRNERWQLNS